MSSHVQIIGTGDGQSSPALFLFTDQTRYLFNVPECTQRICTQYKVRLAKGNKSKQCSAAHRLPRHTLHTCCCTVMRIATLCL